VKHSRSLVCCLSLSLWFLLSADSLRGETYTFFSGTQYPLQVYFLEGDLPGPTVMVQGGIQGDESAGFITAQILTRSRVYRGNLLIVPRANIPSILLRKRAVNVDMNRRFDRDYNGFYEDRLARVIRLLVSQSDAFIHLHEGSGFYHPQYIDGTRNPGRFGQSIVIDAPVLWKDGGAGAISLAQTVSAVLDDLNPEILPPWYRFNLFSTNTLARDTLHPEQRKSLTCYALSNVGIPAVAIEVSKNIEEKAWKVVHQLRAVELFLRRFGVEIAPAAVTAADFRQYPPKDVSLLVNGQRLTSATRKPLWLDPDSHLSLAVNPESASELFAPEWAVFASDRPGINLLRAPRLSLQTFENLEVLADGIKLGRIPVLWKSDRANPAAARPGMFACWLNRQLRLVSDGETLEAVEGDQLILDGVCGSRRGEVLNFKGYVSRSGASSGQDIGAEIILDPANFLSQYRLDSRSAQENRYEVVRETPGMPKSRFLVRIVPRQVREVVLVNTAGRTLSLDATQAQEQVLPEGTYALKELRGNGSREGVTVMIDRRPIAWGGRFPLYAGGRLNLSFYQSTTFLPIGRFALTGAKSTHPLD